MVWTCNECYVIKSTNPLEGKSGKLLVSQMSAVRRQKVGMRSDCTSVNCGELLKLSLPRSKDAADGQRPSDGNNGRDEGDAHRPRKWTIRSQAHREGSETIIGWGATPKV